MILLVDKQKKPKRTYYLKITLIRINQKRKTRPIFVYRFSTNFKRLLIKFISHTVLHILTALSEKIL
jgi:hypothetical protein